MAIENETLAENLNQVVSESKEPEVEPTQSEESTQAFEEKAEKKEEDASKEEKAEKENNSASEPENKEEKVEESEKEKVEDNACGTEKEECKMEKVAEKEEMAGKAESEKRAEKEEKVEDKKEDKEKEDKPLTKSERKTYEANEKSYLAKIASLKAELAAYKPYKAMYEQADKEIKELLEYKEEAELNKLMQQKSDYFKTFGMAEFDDEDRDEIIKKINDYDFPYQDFKAFMADKVQKYGMKSRFQNITDIINMYADNSDVADKYAESDVESDEDKILNRYNNI